MRDISSHSRAGEEVSGDDEDEDGDDDDKDGDGRKHIRGE